MRKISLLHQIFGRHGPRHWFSGLIAFLICLINIFSVVGIGFALPTSQATSLTHSARSLQSAPQVSQQRIQAQVSTQKAPQHSLKTQTPAQKVISHKTHVTSPLHLKPHARQIPFTAPAAFAISYTASTTKQVAGGTITYILTVATNGATAPEAGETIAVTDTVPLTGVTAIRSVTGDWSTPIITPGSPNTVITFNYTGAALSGLGTGVSLSTVTISGLDAATSTLTNTAQVVATSITDTTPTTTTIATTPTVAISLPDLALAITDNQAPATCIAVGSSAQYTLAVTNNNTTTSPTITYTGGLATITGTIPATLSSITFSGTGWVASVSGTTLTANYSHSFTVTTGVPGSTTIPALVVTGTITSLAGSSLITSDTLTNDNTFDTATLDKTATDTITVCHADLKITQSHTPTTSPLQVGQSITYTIAVTNTGTNASTLPVGQIVTVTDTVPAGLTAISSSGTGWGFNNTSTTITATYTVPTAITVGGTIATNIVITGTLTTGSVGTNITNTATVATPMDVLAAGETEQTSTDTITGVALPDLSANLAVTNAGCNGAPITYTLTVSNAAGAGPVLATYANPITVVITAPATLTGVTLAPVSGWTIVGLTANYTGTYPMAAGTSLPVLTITGTPVLPATSPIVLSAKASIATSATTTLVDANPANDTAASTLTVCAPDLAITKTHAGTAPFVVGQTIVYTISVTNISPVSVPTGGAITVTDTLPAGMANPWAIGNSWNLSITNGTLTGNYAGTYPVATGALPSITISATLTSAAGATVSNTAAVASTPADGNLTNNSATDTFAVTTLPNTPAPDVAVTFAHTGTACVASNGAVTYTLGATNSATAGPIYTGQPITVKATLPTNMNGITLSTPGNWALSLSGNVLTGTYNAPVGIGGILPAITIMGNLTNVTAATLTGTATVTLANDSNTANNTATDTLTICTPDLAIVKTHVGTGPFKIGTAVTFNLAISNVGTAPILAGQPITVTDLVPSGISSVTATAATGWTITAIGSSVVANYSGTYPVAPAAILAPILVSGQISSLDPTALTNTATVSTPGDVNLTNNTSTDKIPTTLPSTLPTAIPTTLPSNTQAPDLSVRIDSPGSCVSKNNKATFTFKVSNGANAGSISHSTPISLTFRIPDGLGQISFSGSHWTWKKEGAVVTATYVHSQTINSGDDLSAFAMTGVVTKSRSTKIWVGVRVYTHDDSKRNNDTDYAQFSVC